jgi:hypothetical protein
VPSERDAWLARGHFCAKTNGLDSNLAPHKRLASDTNRPTAYVIVMKQEINKSDAEKLRNNLIRRFLVGLVIKLSYSASTHTFFD